MVHGSTVEGSRLTNYAENHFIREIVLEIVQFWAIRFEIKLKGFFINSLAKIIMVLQPTIITVQKEIKMQHGAF